MRTGLAIIGSLLALNLGAATFSVNGLLSVGTVRRTVDLSLWHFAWNGQSLSVGSLATNPASTSVIYAGKSLMWSGGIHLGEPGWTNHVLTADETTSFGDLIAEIKQEPLRSESPVITMVNGVNARLTSPRRILGTSSGLGNMTLSNLSVGTIPYSNFVTHVTRAQAVAGSNGWASDVKAICWAHGEQDTYLDQTSADNYRTNAYNLYGQMVEDVQAATGQTNEPVWLFTQSASSSWYGSANSLPALAQYRLARQDPVRMKVICPTYVVPPQSDGLHFLTDGYRYVGEQAAKIYVAGPSWAPLIPTNVVKTTTNVLVTFHVPVPPLVLDTNAVAYMTNFGFSFISGTVSALPYLVGSNAVSIPYTGTPTYVQYAWALGGTTNNGPLTGQRGNLRDSDPAMAVSMPTTNLYNWALVFRTILTTNAAPTGASAAVESESVRLLCDYLNTAHAFSFKRSLTFGGPYSLVANSPTNGFLDTSPTLGVTNYYVVSSWNDVGESANSAQVFAKP